MSPCSTPTLRLRGEASERLIGTAAAGLAGWLGPSKVAHVGWNGVGCRQGCWRRARRSCTLCRQSPFDMPHHGEVDDRDGQGCAAVAVGGGRVSEWRAGVRTERSRACRHSSGSTWEQVFATEGQPGGCSLPTHAANTTAEQRRGGTHCRPCLHLPRRGEGSRPRRKIGEKQTTPHEQPGEQSRRADGAPHRRPRPVPLASPRRESCWL
jgi:hypothetical protein